MGKTIRRTYGNEQSRTDDKSKNEKTAQISKPGAAFQMVEREIPERGPGQVRTKVNACVCHSDVLVKEGAFPWIQYPRVPGHETAGIVDELGAGEGTLTHW